MRVAEYKDGVITYRDMTAEEIAEQNALIESIEQSSEAVN